MLMLSGCKNHEEIKAQTVFSSGFTLSYNEMQIKGTIETFEDKSAEIKVESPEELKGLNISSKDGNYNIVYNGMTLSYTEENLPDGAFFKLILIALEKIQNSGTLEFEKVDSGYKAEEQTELGDISVVLDEKFFIKSIKIQKQGFNLKLENSETK